MNYNYPQNQYQQQQQFTNYGNYKPMPPQYPQWAAQQGTQFPQVRPVSSIEEVKACPIDFDGSVFYFADVANKRIYTKQINMDGTASINLYELKIPTQADQNETSYVTRQEFETVINKLKELCNFNYNNIISNNTAPIEKDENVKNSTAQPKPQFII